METNASHILQCLPPGKPLRHDENKCETPLVEPVWDSKLAARSEGLPWATWFFREHFPLISVDCAQWKTEEVLSPLHGNRPLLQNYNFHPVKVAKALSKAVWSRFPEILIPVVTQEKTCTEGGKLVASYTIVRLARVKGSSNAHLGRLTPLLNGRHGVLKIQSKKWQIDKSSSCEMTTWQTIANFSPKKTKKNHIFLGIRFELKCRVIFQCWSVKTNNAVQISINQLRMRKENMQNENCLNLCFPRIRFCLGGRVVGGGFFVTQNVPPVVFETVVETGFWTFFKQNKLEGDWPSGRHSTSRVVRKVPLLF